jgi:SAM-dependent methyltransferase
MGEDDVPSPIDFHDPTQAREWEEQTVKNRPYRPKFFGAFADTLNAWFQQPFAVLELGSGSGHLAEAIMSRCPVRSYTALDFSAAMHDLAQARLALFRERVQFVTRDFRDAGWPTCLGSFEAVVTMQAAHETRHKRHLVPLLAATRRCLVDSGLLLYCDHYFEPAVGKHPDLYFTRDHQAEALRQAGFARIERIWDEGGIALYSASQ